MEKEETLLRKRLIELSNNAYQRGIIMYSDFLNLNELNILHTTPKDSFPVPYRTFGGYDPSERQMAAFLPDAFYMYMDEESMRRRAAANYVQSGHFKEAMNVLDSLGQKNGEWYYLAAMANMGMGNNVTALDQIREAVRQEPDNMQYRMLLQRMEGGGGWYQQRQDPFGGMPTAGGDMCDACCRTMACFMCWPGGFFCC